MTPVCVLVGAPGAGKTVVGRLVAARLGVAFRDTDADIAATAGKPVSAIFIDDGEPAFRALERDAVAAALAKHDGVLALGGGAVLDPATRADLAGHTVVHLAVELPTATKRTGLGTGRPLLTMAVNPRATLALLLAERAPLYTEVATLRVETDDRDVDDVAAEVVARLAELAA